jgi:putative transposase
MMNTSEKTGRQSIRVRDYDYSQPGYYCFTICIQDRKQLLGNVIEETMHPSNAGQIIQEVWQCLPERYPHVKLDSFQLMPNHLHGIIALTESRPIQVDTTSSRVPQRFQTHMRTIQAKKVLTPLGEVLRTFKGLSSYLIHKNGMPEFAWQKRYYEFIIRTDKDLNQARHYIMVNPARWGKDPFNE